MRNIYLAGLVGLILVGCNNPVPTTGTLEVQVNAPVGVAPKVSVKGTDFSQSIAQSGIKDYTVQPGNYTVSSEQASSDTGLIYRASVSVGANRLAASATASQTTAVAAGQTSKVGVDYTLAPPQLQLTLTVAPELAGFKPKITLSKGGATTDLDSSQTLDTLEAGNYTVSATPAPTNYVLSLSTTNVTLEAGKAMQLNAVYSRNLGSLQVNISAEAGCTPSVGVALGSTLVQTLTATATLNNLAPGSYTLTPAASSGCSATATPASISVTAGTTATVNVAYTRLQGNASVVLNGLPANAQGSVTLTPQGGTPLTKTGTSPIVFDGLPAGQYTLSASPVVVAGTFVDSYYTAAAPSPATITLSSGAMTGSSSVAYTQRAGTGQIWVAGNGQFSNGGRGTTSLPEKNGAYSITDQALGSSGSFSSFISPSANNGAFRINFDHDGNMYVLYQYANSSAPARIVRISQQNLANGQLSETASGNTVINGAVWMWNGRNINQLADLPPDNSTNPYPANPNNSEPADLAFDKYGNLWVINDNAGIFACVANSRLKAAPATISNYDSQIWGPGTGLYFYVLHNTGQNADNRPFMIPHALAFDNGGNLWFTAGGYESHRTGETSPVKRSSLNRIPAGKISYTATGDCNGGDVSVSPSNLKDWVDIRLDHSLAVEELGFTSDIGPIVKPVTMVLEPGGNAIWVGDFGGNSGTPSTYDYYRDANAQVETAVRIPLSGANLVTSASIRNAVVSHRITIASGSGTDKGLQQVFGLAFDKAGYLWIAANNNVEILTTDTGAAAAGLTDRKGKLYQLDVRNISSQPTYNGTNTIDLRPKNPKTFSVPDEGVGLIGVSINLANPTSLPNIDPTR